MSSDGGYRLPSKIDGHDLLCVSLKIPDDRDYIAAFFGALFELERWFVWERDKEKRGTLAAKYWRQLFAEHLQVANGCSCSCYEYLPHSAVFNFSPDSPWLPSSQPQAGYRSQIWRVGPRGAPGGVVSGVRDTDVWCLPEVSFNFLDVVRGVVTVGFPRFSVNVTGAGVLELHFLQIFQGGYAVVTVDDDPRSADIVNLQSASIGEFLDKFVEIIDSALDFELAPTLVHEVEIVGDGEHHIDVTMIPKFHLITDVRDVFEFGFGGGIRKIAWCSPDQPDNTPPPRPTSPEVVTEVELVKLRVNPENNCEMQQFDPDSQSWTTVLDLAACDAIKKANQTNVLLEFNTRLELTKIVNAELSIFRAGSYSPQSAVNDRDVDERNALYCYVLTRYIDATLDVIADDKEAVRRKRAGAHAVIASLSIVGLALLAIGPLVAGLVLVGIGAATIAALDEISEDELRDESARRQIVCAMYDWLKDQPLSQVRFAQSLDSASFDPGSAADKISNVMAGILSTDEYYLAFVNLLAEHAGLDDVLVNECLTCGQESAACSAYNYVWRNTNPVPSGFVGERYKSHGGGRLGELTKAANADFRWSVDWDEIRITQTFDTPCVPAGIGLGYERKTVNSYYAVIEILTSNGWQRAARQGGADRGRLGAQYFTWANEDRLTVYGVRFRVWSRQAVIWRSTIS